MCRPCSSSEASKECGGRGVRRRSGPAMLGSADAARMPQSHQEAGVFRLGKGRESWALPLMFVSDEDRPLARPCAARGWFATTTGFCEERVVADSSADRLNARQRGEQSPTPRPREGRRRLHTARRGSEPRPVRCARTGPPSRQMDDQYSLTRPPALPAAPKRCQETKERHPKARGRLARAAKGRVSGRSSSETNPGRASALPPSQAHLTPASGAAPEPPNRVEEQA